MTRYFGTDGIRGRANEVLSAPIAFAVGRYLGSKSSRILVGKDTRLSSSMFEAALAAGITSSGADCDLLGVCSTPALAYLTLRDSFEFGIMISASHNPYYDNGIKCFSSQGIKISAELEDEIEAFIDGLVELPLALDARVGQVLPYTQGMREYLDFLKSSADFSLRGQTIVLDLANGSTTTSAVQIFESLGAKLVVLADRPNGININADCGSTHPERAQAKVLEVGASMGFTFDGDGDRCIAIDEFGQLVTGDKILYSCGVDLQQRGELSQATVVTTIMANLGLIKALKAKDIASVQTSVGDKYVYEEMVSHDFTLGGEQSGHVIFKQYLPTGDGVLTALMLCRLVAKRGQSLAELTQACVIYPQVLVNVRVQDKQQVMRDEGLQHYIKRWAQQLGDEGRVLVRPSGTEPLIRVMAEARDEATCNQLVDDVAGYIQKNFQ